MIPRKYLVLVSTIGTIVSFDQFMKFLVLTNATMSQAIVLVEGFFQINLKQNKGLALDFASNLEPQTRDLVILLSFALFCLGLVYIVIRTNENRPTTVYAASCMLGGATGNLIDRLRIGYVIDYLDFHLGSTFHFPTINAADVFIMLGGALFFWSIIKESELKDQNS